MKIQSFKIINKSGDDFLLDKKGVCFLDINKSRLALRLTYKKKYSKQIVLDFMKTFLPRKKFIYIGRPEKGKRVILKTEKNLFENPNFIKEINSNFDKWVSKA